ncbi:22251_t:CDS:2, partial [Gigaspora margarita]
KEIKFFNTKDNSILPSNLTQTIYKSLISIPEIDENLEGDIGFSLNVVNVSIKIDTENKLATIKINHQLLYPRPENIATTNKIKEYIINNLDYTSKAYMVRYKQDNSESLSAQLLLQEMDYLFLF